METSAIQIAPATSTTRGDVVLQPNYFTSSVYVKALRDDISTLVVRYHEAYIQAGMNQPFSVFKDIWKALGWTWLHFKVFDSRSRHTFLEVTVRLFLGMSISIVEFFCLLTVVRTYGQDRSAIYSSSSLVWHVHFFLFSNYGGRS